MSPAPPVPAKMPVAERQLVERHRTHQEWLHTAATLVAPLFGDTEVGYTTALSKNGLLDVLFREGATPVLTLPVKKKNLMVYVHEFGHLFHCTAWPELSHTVDEWSAEAAAFFTESAAVRAFAQSKLACPDWLGKEIAERLRAVAEKTATDKNVKLAVQRAEFAVAVMLDMVALGHDQVCIYKDFVRQLLEHGKVKRSDVRQPG